MASIAAKGPDVVPQQKPEGQLVVESAGVYWLDVAAEQQRFAAQSEPVAPDFPLRQPGRTTLHHAVLSCLEPAAQSSLSPYQLLALGWPSYQPHVRPFWQAARLAMEQVSPSFEVVALPQPSVEKSSVCEAQAQE